MGSVPLLLLPRHLGHGWSSPRRRCRYVKMPFGTSNVDEFGDSLRQAIAVATDNSSACCTMSRGFASRSFEINYAIKLLREQFPQDKFDIDFCFVPGKQNPADKPSRGINDNAESGQQASDFNNLRRLAGIYSSTGILPRFEQSVLIQDNSTSTEKSIFSAVSEDHCSK